MGRGLRYWLVLVFIGCIEVSSEVVGGGFRGGRLPPVGLRVGVLVRLLVLGMLMRGVADMVGVFLVRLLGDDPQGGSAALPARVGKHCIPHGLIAPR